MSSTSLVFNLPDNDNTLFIKSHTKKIQDSLDSISNNFLKIGFLLNEVNQSGWYKTAHYDNIVEYSLCEFGFKKSQTYNFLKVVDLFAERNPSGSILYLKLKEPFKDYNFTQLCILSTVDPKYYCRFHPTMSCAIMRDTKLHLKDLEAPKDSFQENDVSSSQVVEASSPSSITFDRTSAKELLSLLNKVDIKKFSIDSEGTQEYSNLKKYKQLLEEL